MSHQACQGDCPCCNGACCTESGCVLANCWECTQIHGGLWQGLGTECVDGDCPCDPPADHTQCERCEGGTVSSRCSEGQVCCPPSAENICCLGQCGECLTNEDCPEGHECFECQCILIGNCDEDEDCGNLECCVDWFCTPVPCPSVSVLSCSWCGIDSTLAEGLNVDYSDPPCCPQTSCDSLTFSNLSITWNDISLTLSAGRNIAYATYTGPDGDCEAGGARTKYWLVIEHDPEPNGNSISIPGVDAPQEGYCRIVWRAWAGYGYHTDPHYGDPIKCEAKAYFLYVDIPLCGNGTATLTTVEDTGYDWTGWTEDCESTCDQDYEGWFDTAPSLTITYATPEDIDVTRYWLVVNTEPDEIQEASPSPLYTYPVPGVDGPAGKMCRYVWRVFVGYGPQSQTPSSTQPVRCDGKLYYLYIDIDRCQPAGGAVSVVEDTGYGWHGWTQDCAEPCDTDYGGCMSQEPAMTITVAP